MLTWMLIGIYGSLFTAGNALHSLPGFDHGHCHSHVDEHEQDDSHRGHDHGGQSHGCCHSHGHSAESREGVLEELSPRPQVEGQHECQLCKWLGLPIAVTPLALLVAEAGSVSPSMVMLPCLVILDAVPIETVRGPPSVL